MGKGEGGLGVRDRSIYSVHSNYWFVNERPFVAASWILSFESVLSLLLPASIKLKFLLAGVQGSANIPNEIKRFLNQVFRGSIVPYPETREAISDPDLLYRTKCTKRTSVNRSAGTSVKISPNHVNSVIRPPFSFLLSLFDSILNSSHFKLELIRKWTRLWRTGRRIVIIRETRASQLERARYQFRLRFTRIRFRINAAQRTRNAASPPLFFFICLAYDPPLSSSLFHPARKFIATNRATLF